MIKDGGDHHSNSSSSSLQLSSIMKRHVLMCTSKSKLNRHCEDDIIKIPSNNVQMDLMSIGRGSFSKVHRVRIQDSTKKFKKSDRYALKCLNVKSLLVSDTTTTIAATAATNKNKNNNNNTNNKTLEQPLESAISDLLFEADILSKLHHPNIIQLHGLITSSNNSNDNEVDNDDDVSLSSSSSSSSLSQSLLLVDSLLLDLLEETLESRLIRWRNQVKMIGYSSLHSHHHIHQKQQIQHDTLVYRIQSVAIGIAKGMAYLHSKNVILRDLKPENIGFDCNGNVKIFDFGFAREIHTLIDNEIAGSYRYMSPENLLKVHQQQQLKQQQRQQGNNNNTKTMKKSSLLSLLPSSSSSSSYHTTTSRTSDTIIKASDVYSFGLILYELCTLNRPYSHIKSEKELINTVALKQWRPSLLLDYNHYNNNISIPIPSQLLRQLIKQCWIHNPMKRPNFDTICNQLVLKTISRTNRRKLIKHKQKKEFSISSSSSSLYYKNKMFSFSMSSLLFDKESSTYSTSTSTDYSSSSSYF